MGLKFLVCLCVCTGKRLFIYNNYCDYGLALRTLRIAKSGAEFCGL